MFALWYRRKHGLLKHLTLEIDYENWLRVANGQQIRVVECTMDDEITGS